MEHPGFFERAGPFPLSDVAKAADAELAGGVNPHLMIDDVRPLSEARAHHVSFIDNRKYLPQLEATAAGACLVAPPFAGRVPKATASLLTKLPYHGFARALALFYPTAMMPMVSRPGAPAVDSSAMLEEGCLLYTSDAADE